MSGLGSLLCALFVTGGETALAQQVNFTKVGLPQGLSQSTVYAIAQDRHGYFWFATRSGISIYDGHRMRYLRHNPHDRYSLSDDHVQALLLGKDGRMYIGTRNGGLNIYDPLTGKIIRARYGSRVEKDNEQALSKAEKDHAAMKRLHVFQINCLFQTKDGLLWIGGPHGLSVLNPVSMNIRHYVNIPGNLQSLPMGNVSAIAETENGDLWVGTDYGLAQLPQKSQHEKGQAVFVRHLHDRHNVYSLSHNQVLALKAGENGTLWIGTGGGVVDRLNVATLSFQHYYLPANRRNVARPDRVMALFVENSSEIWIGTEGQGLLHLHPESNRFTIHNAMAKHQGGLSSNFVLSMFKGHSGMLWVGTDGGGVNHFAHGQIGFQQFTPAMGEKKGPSDRMIRAFVEHVPSGHIFLSTNNGVEVLDPVHGTFYRDERLVEILSELNALVVTAMVLQGRTLWLGTKSVGLVRYHLDDGSFQVLSFAPGGESYSQSRREVTSLLIDKAGTLWVGTLEGLYLVDPQMGRVAYYKLGGFSGKSSSSDEILSLNLDLMGRVWVGAIAGIGWISPKSRKFHPLKLQFKKEAYQNYNPRIYDVHQAMDGMLWLASDIGVIKHNFTTLRSRVFLGGADAPVGKVFNILPDNDVFWLTSEKGVIKFFVPTGEFRIYTEKMGLVSNECNPGAVLKSSRQEFYIGTVQGLVRFKSHWVQINKIPPRLHVQLAVLDKQGKFRKVEEEEGNVKILYSDRGIEIHFLALHYVNPLENQYRYRLKGHELEWNYVRGGPQKFFYSGLRPGRYELEIEAANYANIWMKQAFSKILVIEPPVWQKTLSQALFLALLVVLAMGFYIKLTRRIRQQLAEKSEEEHQKKLLEEKEWLISKLDDVTLRMDDMVHELNTPIMLMGASIEKLLQSLAQPQGVMAMQGSSMDILMSLESLKENMAFMQTVIDGQCRGEEAECVCLEECFRSFLSSFLPFMAEKKINYQVEIKAKNAIIRKKALQGILANLVINAARYTPNGGRVCVNICVKEERVVFQVCDTGIGIESELQSAIFERGIRTAAAELMNKTGKGQGLAILADKVKKLNGDVTVKSKPGEGACFSVAILHEDCERDEVM